MRRRQWESRLPVDRRRLYPDRARGFANLDGMPHCIVGDRVLPQDSCWNLFVERSLSTRSPMRRLIRRRIIGQLFLLVEMKQTTRVFWRAAIHL